MSTQKQAEMHVAAVPMTEIVISRRMRPVDPAAIPGMKAAIEAEGLRQPIELADLGHGKYQLIDGAHRLEACTQLGWTSIPASIRPGATTPELKRLEITTQLARKDLTKLERCQFLAELKSIYQELHPEAKHGGDRTGEQTAKLADWYAEVAGRSYVGVRTIEREAAIGEKLSPAAADELRGTPFEDNQSELEALVKKPETLQVRLAKMVTRKSAPLPSIRAALAEIDGQPVQRDADEEQFRKLVDAWTRAGTKARKQFRGFLAGPGVVKAQKAARSKKAKGG